MEANVSQHSRHLLASMNMVVRAVFRRFIQSPFVEISIDAIFFIESRHISHHSSMHVL